MGIYNFKKRFVPKILSGEKTQTIRANRRYPDTPGKTMHLFTGLRTKAARCLGRETCKAVQNIRIDLSPGTVTIYLDGRRLTHHQCEAFARRDGFESWEEMVMWWEKVHGRRVFVGTVYHWQVPLPL